MPAKIILNPYANRWRARERIPEVVSAAQGAGIEHELVVTDAPGQGIALAAQAVRAGFRPIIAAGGDGSISEVVNGMMQAAGEGPLPPLGVLPLGSANDLVDNLGLPDELAPAAQVIAAGKVRNLDICQANERFFDNNSAIGLEPYITLIQQRIGWIRGEARYLVATLRGVLDNPGWQMHLAWEGGNYQGPVTLVTVGNCPRTGGVFYVTPHADPFDGLLTFVYGYLPTRTQILKVLPRLMKPGAGNYVEHPSIHEIHSPWLSIRVESPTPMHADGEIQSTALQEVNYRVLPGRLPIYMP
jgi:diacylglycerol kinase (ATP)